MGESRRWSDERLDRFEQDFQVFKEEYQAHVLHEEAMAETNAAAIQEIAKNTGELVLAWNSAQSVVRAGATLGRFAKWAASLAVIGAIFNWLVDHS